jgi:hypothetical protein
MNKILRLVLISVGIFLAAFAVFILILYLLYPPEVGLFFSALFSLFNSPSQSKAFSSPGVNFNYPANWVTVNISIFSSAISNQSNTSVSRFGNKSQIVVIVPAAEIISFAADGPSLLSQYLAHPSNFTPPSGLSFVVSGAINVLKRSFYPRVSILEAVPGANITNITIGGYNGVHVAFLNQTILKVKEYFSELSVAETNGSVCFVFGFASQPGEVGDLNQSFNRVAQSLSCDFSQIGISVPSSILDKFLAILG